MKALIETTTAKSALSITLLVFLTGCGGGGGSTASTLVVNPTDMTLFTDETNDIAMRSTLDDLYLIDQMQRTLVARAPTSASCAQGGRSMSISNSSTLTYQVTMTQCAIAGLLYDGSYKVTASDVSSNASTYTMSDFNNLTVRFSPTKTNPTPSYYYKPITSAEIRIVNDSSGSTITTHSNGALTQIYVNNALSYTLADQRNTTLSNHYLTENWARGQVNIDYAFVNTPDESYYISSPKSVQYIVSTEYLATQGQTKIEDTHGNYILIDRTKATSTYNFGQASYYNVGQTVARYTSML